MQIMIHLKYRNLRYQTAIVESDYTGLYMHLKRGAFIEGQSFDKAKMQKIKIP